MPTAPHEADIEIFCPACRYNLHGIADGSCPECGTTFNRKHLLAIEKKGIKSFWIVCITHLSWPVIYWFTIAPFLLTGWALLMFTSDEWLGTPWPGLVVGGLLTLGVTFYFTRPVALDLALQVALRRRQKYPHLPPPNTTTLTWLLLFVELAVIAALPLVVLGILFVLF